MNWKLIFLLSLFGLAMAFATVNLIPFNVEPFFWLGIIIFCAGMIAYKCSSKFFWNGFFVSIFNSVWITIVHIILFHSYMAHHLEQAEMSSNMPITGHPRLMMAITGPIIGILSGLILGLFSFIASKLVKKKSIPV